MPGRGGGVPGAGFWIFTTLKLDVVPFGKFEEAGGRNASVLYLYAAFPR